jgi:hypothetical protein
MAPGSLCLVLLYGLAGILACKNDQSCMLTDLSVVITACLCTLAHPWVAEFHMVLLSRKLVSLS